MLRSMKPLPLSALALALAACSTLPDTVGEAAPDGVDFALTEFNGKAVDYAATIRFLNSGEVRGQGPCNRYSARQTAPLPWFEVEDIAATRRACEDLDDETAFFEGLIRMDFSEVSGSTLILTNAGGEQMVFVAR